MELTQKEFAEKYPILASVWGVDDPDLADCTWTGGPAQDLAEKNLARSECHPHLFREEADDDRVVEMLVELSGLPAEEVDQILRAASYAS